MLVYRKLLVFSALLASLVVVSAQTISLDQGFVSCAIPWEVSEVEKMYYCTTSRDYQFCQSLDDTLKKCFTFENVETGGNWIEFDLGDNRKEQIIFTKDAVFEENGEIVPFKENYTLSLKNNNFVFEWEKEGLALETELFFSIQGTNYTIAGLKVLAPQIEVKTFQENLSGGTKFWYDIQNVPQEIRDQLEYIKLSLRPVSGFSASSIEKIEDGASETFETVLPEGFGIDFSDLVTTENFDLSFENNYTLIIRDKDESDGKWGENISLDPIFQGTGASEDVHIYFAAGANEVDSRAYFKFNISSVPAGATINSVNLQLQVERDRDDDDYIFYHLDQNQGWTENDTVANIYAMHKGTLLSVTGCYNSQGVDLNCAITSVFQAAYNAGDTNFSFAMEDPDENSTAPDTKNNGNNSFVGDVNANIYLKFDSSEGTVPPVLYVNYTETTPSAPTNLNVDANRLYAKKGRGGGMRLTWVDNSTNETGFRIYRKHLNNNFVLLTTTAAGVTSYDDLATGDNNSLFYKVSAFNTGGDANSSVDSNISLDRSAPAAPTVSLTYAGGSSVDINWPAVDDNSNSGIDNNVLIYYRFDETSGSIAYNSTALDLNGTLTGTSFVNGKLSGGIELFGTDDYVTVPSTLNMNSTNFTFSVWVKPYLSSDHVILEQRDGTGTGRNILAIDADGSFCSNVPYSITSALGGSQICANAKIDQNVWQHLAVTMDSGTLKFYKNGVQTNSLAAGTESNVGDYVLGLAKDLTSTDYNGFMDDFRVYNVALSATDVNNVYLKGTRTYKVYKGTTGGSIGAGLEEKMFSENVLSLAGGIPSSFTVIATLDDNVLHYRDTNAPDTNSPDKPSAPTATAVNSTTIDVNWNAVSDNESTFTYKVSAVDFEGNDSNSSNTSIDINTGVAKYYVNCISGGDCNSSRNGAFDDYNTSALGRRITGLSPNTTYCFKVLTTDGSDNNSSESDSNSSCAATPRSTQTEGGGSLPFCGDGICNGSETCSTCQQDCGTCVNVCGNGICDSGETAKSCPSDCSITYSNVCGDGICTGSETTTSCSSDCKEPTKFSLPATNTCFEQSGVQCRPVEYCLGEWANATDSARCCIGTCYGNSDLVVKVKSSTKTSKGKEGSIAVTIANNGGSTLGGFKIELREVSERSNKIILVKELSALKKGDRVSVLFNIPFEEGLAYSYVSFVATADPDYVIVETERTNNTASASMYFAGEEKCNNGIDDDLDGEIDESQGNVNCGITNLFIKKASVYLPKTKAGKLSSISFSALISAESAKASGAYVHLHKESLDTEPVASIFIESLDTVSEKEVKFEYDYETDTGIALAEENMQQELGRFFIEIEYSPDETTKEDNTLEVTPNFSDHDLKIENIYIPRTIVGGEPIIVTGKTRNSKGGFLDYGIGVSGKTKEQTVLLSHVGGKEISSENEEKTGIEILGTYTLGLKVDGKLVESKQIEFNSSEDFSFNIPSTGLEIGSHNIEISTDFDKQVFESNEANNSSAEETEIIDTINKVYVFRKTINSEPLLVAFWAPRESTESEYSFKLNGNTDLPFEEAITLDHLSNNKNLWIFRLEPTQIPNDSENTIEVYRQALGGEKVKIGETTEFERVPRQLDRIFAESGVSLSEYLTGEKFKRYYYFERLYLLSYLWWNKWKEE